MAKNEQSGNKNGEATTAPAASTPNTAQAAAATTAAAGQRGVPVVLASGERRVDFIKRRFKELEVEQKEGKFQGSIRGKIAKELSEATGVKVPYQIVFAATKTKKDPQAAAPAAAAAS
jgi:hypothetical protein